jgi:hypothetical protein
LRALHEDDAHALCTLLLCMAQDPCDGVLRAREEVESLRSWYALSLKHVEESKALRDITHTATVEARALVEALDIKGRTHHDYPFVLDHAREAMVRAALVEERALHTYEDAEQAARDADLELRAGLSRVAIGHTGPPAPLLTSDNALWAPCRIVLRQDAFKESIPASCTLGPPVAHVCVPPWPPSCIFS